MTLLRMMALTKEYKKVEQFSHTVNNKIKIFFQEYLSIWGIFKNENLETVIVFCICGDLYKQRKAKGKDISKLISEIRF